jgi:uncharacterized repeat protein (TIGR02543 family)/LPXTG-motif cell wall-anchored protein
MKKIKKILFALIITTAFFATTNAFAAPASRSLTIVFHPDKGDEVEIKEVCKDSECDNVLTKLAALQIPSITKNGYTFKGWYTDENFTTPIVDYAHASGQTVNITTDVTWNYYAKWEANSDEGSTAVIDIETYLKLIIDDKTSKEIKICGADDCATTNAMYTKIEKVNLPIQEKDGYKFEGWYLDKKYTAKIKDTKEFVAALKKTKFKTDGTPYTDDDSVPVSVDNDEENGKYSYVLYAKWSQVVKTGNTGISRGILLTIIGILMIGAGSVVVYKKTRKNN